MATMSAAPDAGIARLAEIRRRSAEGTRSRAALSWTGKNRSPPTRRAPSRRRTMPHRIPSEQRAHGHAGAEELERGPPARRADGQDRDRADAGECQDRREAAERLQHGDARQPGLAEQQRQAAPGALAAIPSDAGRMMSAWYAANPRTARSSRSGSPCRRHSVAHTTGLDRALQRIGHRDDELTRHRVVAERDGAEHRPDQEMVRAALDHAHDVDHRGEAAELEQLAVTCDRDVESWAPGRQDPEHPDSDHEGHERERDHAPGVGPGGRQHGNAMIPPRSGRPPLERRASGRRNAGGRSPPGLHPGPPAGSRA